MSILKKITVCFGSVNFFVICALLVKAKILQKHQFLKNFFIFVANGHHFQKCSFLIEILSFLEEISSVFESVNFWWRCYLLVKNNILCKNVSFGAYEWISKNNDKIMSCKLWGKVTNVSVKINFGAKMLILCKKKWNFERNVDFFIKYALPLKVIIILQNMPIFRKMWLFVWRFIYINKVTNFDKNNFSFLWYVNLHMC